MRKDYNYKVYNKSTDTYKQKVFDGDFEGLDEDTYNENFTNTWQSYGSPDSIYRSKRHAFPDEYSYALDFNGSTDYAVGPLFGNRYISVPKGGTVIEHENNFAIYAQVYKEDWTSVTANEHIIGTNDFRLYIDQSTAKLKATGVYDGSSGNVTIEAEYALASLSSGYHLIGLVSEADTLRLIVDGVEQDTTTGTYSEPAHSIDSVYLGKKENSTEYFSGKIDSYALYDTNKLASAMIETHKSWHFVKSDAVYLNYFTEGTGLSANALLGARPTIVRADWVAGRTSLENSAQVLTATGGSAEQGLELTTARQAYVDGDTEYTAHAKVKADSGETVRITITPDTGEPFITELTATGEWQSIQVTGLMPTDAARLALKIGLLNANSAAKYLFVDKVAINEGSTGNVLTDLNNFESGTTGYSASGYNLDFNGSSDYVTWADDDVFDLGASKTFVFLIKNDDTSGTQMILNKGAGFAGWDCYQSGDNMVVRIGDGTSSVTQTAFDAFTETDWKKIHLSFDISGNSNIYVDGVLKDTDDISSLGSLVNSGSFDLCRRNSGSPLYFDGSVKNLKIYDGALSQADVSSDINGNYTGSILAEYLFEDGTGTTLTDTSGNSNDGTITGATWVDERPTVYQRPDEAQSGDNSLLADTNIVENGDFETIPSPSVPQTTTNRYIDGTATGSITDAGFFWHADGVNSFETAEIQTAEKIKGSGALHIHVESGGSGVVEVRSGASGYGTGASEGFAMKPDTTYILSGWIKTANMTGDSNNGVIIQMLEANSGGTNIGSAGSSAYIKTDQDWTYFEDEFTTNSTTARGHVECRFYGHTGAGTLLGDAYFDDIRVYEKSPQNRGAKKSLSGLTSGTQYTVSGYFKQESDTDYCGIIAAGKDQASVISDGNFNRVSLTFTANATTQDLYFVNFTGNNPFYVDYVLINEGASVYEPTATVIDYFDDNEQPIGATNYTYNPAKLTHTLTVPVKNYITTWTDVVNEPNFAIEINTLGGELKLVLARTLKEINNSTIDDLAFANEVRIDVIDDNNPSGKRKFTGFISDTAVNQDAKNVEVILLPYGVQADDYLSYLGRKTIVLQEHEENELDTSGNYGGGRIDQIVKPSSIIKLKAVRVKHDNVDTDTPRLKIYTGDPSENSAATISGATTWTRGAGHTLVATADTHTNISGNEYEYEFDETVTLYPQTDYYIEIDNAGFGPDTGNTYKSAASVIKDYIDQYKPLGLAWAGRPLNNNSSVSWDEVAPLYIELLSESGSSIADFNSVDPSEIVRRAIDDFDEQGGELLYTTTSVQDTDTTVSYKFNTAKISEVLDKALELAPEDWYYYIDPATSTVNFKLVSETAQHKFVQGKHFSDLTVEERTNELVNQVIFTGGEISSGTNLFKIYKDTASIAKYGLRTQIKVDNRVTSEDTAQILANKVLERLSNPVLRVKVTINNSYDIESVSAGDVVTFANTGKSNPSLWDVGNWNEAFWDYDAYAFDSLNLQITRLQYSKDSISMVLTNLPPYINKRIEDIKRNLDKQQTVNNPETSI